MPAVSLEIEPPLWPARRSGLLFLWENGEAPNLVFDPVAGGERATLLEPAGRAYLDGLYRMVLGKGLFAASAEESNRLRWALQAVPRSWTRSRMASRSPSRTWPNHP